MHPILFRLPLPHFGSVPIYSYGIMLALSLIVGWFLTLGLAERDGLPKEAMANCYVDTAVMALIGSRVLYIVTNPSDFTSFSSLFAMRSGGLVAYGGFLGGFVGSYLSLRYGFGLTGIVRFVARRLGDEDRRPWSPLPLLPWADVAVPSLASGLCITRIGCYLFGCDFGRPLAENAPAYLKHLGTFPRWPEGTMTDGSVGSPAWDHHVRLHLITPDAPASLPVHPTQIYESLVGLALLLALLAMRKNQRFRGEIFLMFTFLYGAARFLLELWRDDTERGNIPPALTPHALLPFCLGLLGIGFVVGIAPRIGHPVLRTVAQLASLLPATWSFVTTQPHEFETVAPIQLSTSQFVGFVSGLLACAGFWALHRAALEHPELAMRLPDFTAHLEEEAADDDEEGDGREEKKRSTRPSRSGDAEKNGADETPEESDEASTREAAPADVGKSGTELSSEGSEKKDTGDEEAPMDDAEKDDAPVGASLPRETPPKKAKKKKSKKRGTT